MVMGRLADLDNRIWKSKSSDFFNHSLRNWKS